MLHKKRITFTVIRFFVVSHREIRTPAVTGGSGERSERCPSGAFAAGENEVSESTETSDERAPSASSDD